MVFPVKDPYITMRFGVPGSYWAAGRHTGTDFRAAVGTPIRATRGGVIEHAGYGGYGSAYGNHVVLRTKTKSGQPRKVLYAHLSHAGVRPGQKVRMGQRLGLSGATGNVTGPHLHYEERVSPFGYYNYAAPVFLAYDFPKLRIAVRLSKLKPGSRSMSVRRVRRRLRKRNIHVKRGNHFNEEFRNGYKRWQERLGYRGSDANGIPGPTSLKRLGFRVRR